MSCCARCDQTPPAPKWHGLPTNEALLEGYVIKRRRYRAEYPHVSRAALAMAEDEEATGE